MRGPLFNLSNGPEPLPERVPAPEFLRLPLDARDGMAGFEVLVAEGDAVLADQTVARARDQRAGDLHAPLAGQVTELNENHIEIQVQGEGRTEAAPLSGLAEGELRRALRRAGVDQRWPDRFRHLIINGVPPEPGMPVHEQLLTHYRAVLAQGLAAIRKACGPVQVTLATLSGDAAHFGNCTVVHVPPEYPRGLDPLVVKAVTGREYDDESAVISVPDLYAVGQAMQTGRPVTEQFVAVAGRTLPAPIGTPAGHLLKLAGIEINQGDVVVLGGAFTGQALFSLNQGIPKGVGALSVVPGAGRMPVRDAACTGCGECVLICPARIRPDLLSRAAEFKLFDRARSMDVEACMECGLCGFVCPTRRPILQYIRLAKHELALMDKEEAAS